MLREVRFCVEVDFVCLAFLVLLLQWWEVNFRVKNSTEAHFQFLFLSFEI